jgi:hypothetical protein
MLFSWRFAPIGKQGALNAQTAFSQILFFIRQLKNQTVILPCFCADSTGGIVSLASGKIQMIRVNI